MPAGKSPDRLLFENEVDALALPLVPDAFLEGAGHIRRLFPDPRRVAIDDFRRTGDFPILHTVVVRDGLACGSPGVATLVRDLFEEPKQWYVQYAAQPARLGQTFGSLDREEEQAVLGRVSLAVHGRRQPALPPQPSIGSRTTETTESLGNV